jgi:hypothetical protein
MRRNACAQSPFGLVLEGVVLDREPESVDDLDQFREDAQQIVAG